MKNKDKSLIEFPINPQEHSKDGNLVLDIGVYYNGEKLELLRQFIHKDDTPINRDNFEQLLLRTH